MNYITLVIVTMGTFPLLKLTSTLKLDFKLFYLYTFHCQHQDIPIGIFQVRPKKQRCLENIIYKFENKKLLQLVIIQWERSH